MVINFEEYTAPLSDDDLKLVEVIMSGLKLRTAANPVKSGEIMKGVNARLKDYGVKSKLVEARLRKIVNYIRVHSLLCVIATSKGYYTTSDPDEIRANVQSLRDRVRGIEAAAAGLEKFLDPAFNQKQQQPTLF